MKKYFTRREFIKNTALASIGSALYLNRPVSASTESASKSRVVLIRDKNVLDRLNRPNAEIIQEMLDRAVKTLLNTDDTQAAWKKLVRPEDIVGIKTNVWRRLATPPELEQAIKKRVMECGVAEADISIKDRGILKDPVFQKASALINVRPLRTHDWSGVGSLIKNYIMFVKRPSAYHGDSCADLASIWHKPLIKDKTRLNILVMLTPLFHGMGPHHYNPKYVWPYSGLIVSLDPVAADSTGVRILAARRRAFFGEDRPINPPPKHIMLAETRHKLGYADPNKIELIKLGWQDEILI